ncbi:unnamed protein product [Fusarium fujikuroi]|uniref:Uncharacterized protein n=1 Tax=Fusarium fujikuroi TaxID=5127 RepID=A0A9Q9RG47_FUSFU|nr:uncharacterized protein FFE2_09650 [Fusarium fujikuroi]SCO38249.1 uncharacterized protein FFNC_06124 [Fusarium fujikuroi]VTT60125.1 unnamed protein product [Fusarium fujikuroi]VTT75554.1 unnamed protein product [Fusarium fujikuroi]VZH87957.1 unnamed protein product [Fusarium fujikuroi]
MERTEQVPVPVFQFCRKNEEDSTNGSIQSYDLAMGYHRFRQYALFIHHTILSPGIDTNISNSSKKYERAYPVMSAFIISIDIPPLLIWC